MAKRRCFLGFALIAVVYSLIGCSNNGTPATLRSDGQIAADVQNKINGDNAIQTKTVTATSTNGVVSLSGTVTNDTEKMVASNDAASIEGVKQVISNLSVQPTMAGGSTPRSNTSHSYRPNSGRNGTSEPSGSRAGTRSVTIPTGTTLSVRTIDALSSETSHENDGFHGTLTSEVYGGDNIAIPSGADVQGRVVEAHPSTHFTGTSSLILQLTRVSYGGNSYNLVTDTWAKTGSARGGNTIKKAGGGAALGAIIGAIAGGGRGAAIGAGAGAAAGTGVNAITKGEKIVLAPESLVTFRLQNPISVTPGAASTRHRIEPSNNN